MRRDPAQIAQAATRALPRTADACRHAAKRNDELAVSTRGWLIDYHRQRAAACRARAIDLDGDPGASFESEWAA